jgi:hypothetical protein
MTPLPERMVEAGARAIFEASGTARLQSWESYRDFYSARGVLSPDYYAQARAALTAALAVAEEAGAGVFVVPDGRDWEANQPAEHVLKARGYNDCRADTLAGKVTL